MISRNGPYEIGALYRNEFRRNCLRAGVRFQEQKGLLDSTFMIDGPPANVRAVHNWVCDVVRENARLDREAADREAAKQLRKQNRWYRRAWRHLFG